MANVKEEVIRLVGALPDNVTVDDVMAELYFKLHVDAGLRELDEGKGVPHKQAKKRLRKWLTK